MSAVLTPLGPGIVTPPPIQSSGGAANGMLTPTVPFLNYSAGLRRFTVEEYEAMLHNGILIEGERVELLDGYVVNKMAIDPPHATSVTRLRKRIGQALPSGWDYRIQNPIRLATSMPEPDFAVVRGDDDTYQSRHPLPADIGLLVEVTDSTLRSDRREKLTIYAAAGIAVYWIVNIVDRVVEVYEGPAASSYSQRRDYQMGESLSIILDGMMLKINVADILPPQ